MYIYIYIVYHMIASGRAAAARVLTPNLPTKIIPAKIA